METDYFYNLKAGMTFEEVKSHTISINPQPDINGEWFSFYPEKEDFPYKYFSCKITKKFGLTKICAWTQNIQTKNNGAELFSLFEHIRDKENLNFGKDRLYHVLKEDSTFTAPEQFTLSLVSNQRLLISVYAPAFGSTLPENCRFVQLQAYARDEYSGNVMKKISLINDQD